MLRMSLVLTAVCVASGLSARTVEWSGSVESQFLKSNGVEHWEDDLQFELGSFNLGFSPTSENLAEWGQNWLTFDTASSTDGWNSAMGYLTSVANTLPAVPGWVYSTSDPAGSTTTNLFRVYDGTTESYQQAYIWAYNSKSLGIGSEWALVGNSKWTFPASNSFNPASVVFALRDGSATLGNLTFEDQGTTSFEVLQTVSVQSFSSVAVPEAGSVVLMTVAAGCFGFRRRGKRPVST